MAHRYFNDALDYVIDNYDADLDEQESLTEFDTTDMQKTLNWILMDYLAIYGCNYANDDGNACDSF